MNDPLRWCPQHGCLLHRKDNFCPWHGARLEPLLGKTINGYRVDGALSDGGFGVIYKATNLDNEEFVVALKVLKPPYCYRKQSVREFLDEAINTQGIRSINIAPIMDVNRRPWPHLTMQLIQGQTLDKVIHQRKLSRAQRRRRLRVFTAVGSLLGRDKASRAPPLFPAMEALDYLVGIARPLAQAHTLPVPRLHRDLKPLNVMLEEPLPDGRREDRIRVIDWGIALKLANVERDPEKTLRSEEDSVKRKRQVVGTLPYMASECFEGHYSTQSDVYAFGVTAFELLTGQRPHPSPVPNTARAWRELHSRPPRRVEDLCSRVPRGLRQLLRKCLATEPTRRYADGAALLEGLESLRVQFDGRRKRQRNFRIAGAAALLVLSLVAFQSLFKLPVDDTSLLRGLWRREHVQGHDFYMQDANCDALLEELKTAETRLDVSGKRLVSVFIQPRGGAVEERLELRPSDGGLTLHWNAFQPILKAWTGKCRENPGKLATLTVDFHADLNGFLRKWINTQLRFHWDNEPPRVEQLQVVSVDKQTFTTRLPLRANEETWLPAGARLLVAGRDDQGFVRGESAMLRSGPEPRRLGPGSDPSSRWPDPAESSFSYLYEVPETAVPQAYEQLSIELSDVAGNTARHGLFPHPRSFYERQADVELVDNTAVVVFKVSGGAPMPEARWFRVRILGGAKASSRALIDKEFVPESEAGRFTLRLQLPEEDEIAEGTIEPLMALSPTVDSDEHFVPLKGSPIGFQKANPALDLRRVSEDFELSITGADGSSPQLRLVFLSGNATEVKARTRVQFRPVRLTVKRKSTAAQSGGSLTLRSRAWAPAGDGVGFTRAVTDADWPAEDQAGKPSVFKDALTFTNARGVSHTIYMEIAHCPECPRPPARLELDSTTSREGRKVLGRPGGGERAALLYAAGDRITFSAGWDLEEEEIAAVSIACDAKSEQKLAYGAGGEGRWSSEPLDIEKLAKCLPRGSRPSFFGEAAAGEGPVPLTLRVGDRSGNVASFSYCLYVYEKNGEGPCIRHDGASLGLTPHSRESSMPMKVEIWSAIGLESLVLKTSNAELRDEPKERKLKPSDLPPCASSGGAGPEDPGFEGRVLTLEEHAGPDHSGQEFSYELTATDIAGRSSTAFLRVTNSLGIEAPASLTCHRRTWVLLGNRSSPPFVYATADEVSRRFVLEVVESGGDVYARLKPGTQKRIDEWRRRGSEDSRLLDAAAGGIPWSDAKEIARASGWELMSYDQWKEVLKSGEEKLQARLSGGAQTPEALYRELCAEENIRHPDGEPDRRRELVSRTGSIRVESENNGEDNPTVFCGLRQFLGNYQELVVEDGNPAKAWIVGLKYSLGLRLKKQDSGIDPYLLEGGKIELLPSAFSRPFENYDEDRMQGSNVFESVGFRFVVKPDEAGRDKDLWEVFHRCCKAKNHVGKR